MRFQLPGRRDSVRVSRRDLDRILMHLNGFDLISDGKDAARILPRIRGAAAEYAVYPAVATALTTAQVAFLGPLENVPQTPLVLGLAYIPTVTTQTAAATIVLNFNRTDTPAVIGGSTYLTPTAGTVNSAPVNMLCIVPFGIPAVNGISVSGSDTAGTAIPTGTATRPMIIAMLGLS